MQGFERMDGELLDTAVGQLVPAGSMFAFLAAHRAEVFPDADYADLFAPPGVGRPSLPATRMAAVLTLQVLHDYSDRETAEAARFDVRWKAAIGAPLDDPGFDPSSLVYWRNRIARSARPDRISDAVRKIVEQTGVLGGRRRRAVDSTVLADAVATQDTVTQLVAAIRKVAREVPGAAGQIAAVCAGHDYSKPGKPAIDWDDPAAKDALVSALVNDANALVAALRDRDLEERAASALALLALVAGQDVEPAEGSDGTDGRWRIARKVAPDRVISTVDPQARHTRKSRSQRRDGYRGHLAAEPDTGLITDCELSMATGQDNTDAAVGVRMAGRDRFPPTTTGTGTAGTETSAAGTETAATETGGDATETAGGENATHETERGLEVYGDSAYGSGEARAAYRAAGHDTVIKPKPLQPAVPGGFTLDDFGINEPAGTVTCPAGHTRTMSPSRTVSFGRACDDCPLRARCTTAQTGRSMSIHEHEDLLRAARAQARTPEFKQDYPTRSTIERTVAQVATQNGRRVKLRYRGTTKNNAWLRTRCAALNLRALLRHGLTRAEGGWALA